MLMSGEEPSRQAGHSVQRPGGGGHGRGSDVSVTTAQWVRKGAMGDEALGDSEAWILQSFLGQGKALRIFE